MQLRLLLLRRHFQRQLVVTTQKDQPLAVVGQRRRVAHRFDNVRCLAVHQRKVDLRHQRKVVGRLALVAGAKVGHDIFGRLASLGDQKRVRTTEIKSGAKELDDGVRLRKRFTRSVFSLQGKYENPQREHPFGFYFPNARNGIGPKSIDAVRKPIHKSARDGQ